MLTNVYPTTAPQDAATTDLVNHLRDTTVPQAVGNSGVNVLVGGTTAIYIDFANVLSSKLPLFIGLVVILSFLLLMTVFRSFVIPLTAAVMNLLSIGAALGMLVAVFQWGDLGGLIGLSGTSPVEAFLPVMLFAILFGLSMDYQVFLVSRMHEEYIKSGGDNRVAVRNGLAATGKTITAAALIMILVFGSFILGGNRVIKEFGIGLAGGILVDAILIRMAIVPSIMMMFGKANWWFPAWLDRILPQAVRRRRRPRPPTRPKTRTPSLSPSWPDRSSRPRLSGRARRPRLPGVVLGRRLVPGEDLVEARQHLVVERHVDGAQGRVEVLGRARPDDGPGHRRPGQQPGQADRARLLADLRAEVLVRLELRAAGLDRLGGAAGVAPAAVALLAHDATEQAALQRRPRDHAEPVGLGRRQHLALDRRARSGCRSTARSPGP